MRNRAAILSPRMDNDLVIHTDADNTTTFDPSWTFSSAATGSRVFNGTTDRIDWASIKDMKASPITISAWVYISSNPAHNSWVVALHQAGDTNYGINFFIVTDGSLAFYRNGTAAVSMYTNSAIGTGAWKHILVTHDGVITTKSSIHIYVNGTDDRNTDSGGNGSGETAVAGSWSLGGRIYADDRNVPGSISQVGIWSRVLTSTEIASLAAGAKPDSFSSSLEFYFAGETSSLVATPPAGGSTGTADGTSFSSSGPALAGITMTVDYGDGAYATSATGVSKTYAAGKGRHRVRFSCPDWSRLTKFDIENDATALFVPDKLDKCQSLTEVDLQGSIAAPNNFVGKLPSFNWCKSLVTLNCYGESGAGAVNQLFGLFPNLDQCTGLQVLNLHQSNFSGLLPDCSKLTALTTFDCSNNKLSGTLPSFATCTELTLFECGVNSFSGTMPSFNACTKLVTLSNGGNAFSGTIPTFAACTALVTVQLASCSFTGYTAGSFATQKSLATLQLDHNSLSAAAVNAVLADLVTSLSISGRVACTVTLQNNAAPTGQGITDKNTLNGTSGWSVTTD